jgi:hypothetical protein
LRSLKNSSPFLGEILMDNSSAVIGAETFEDRTYARVTWRLIPFLFLCYVVAYRGGAVGSDSQIEFISGSAGVIKLPI